jgi:transcriptional regulator with XRE-family HTH domain
MRKTLEKIAKQKKVLSKSVLSAAKQLGLTQDQLAIVLNLDSVETLNSLELDPVSSQENSQLFNCIAISLDALTGGEAKWMQHFMNVTQ